MKRKIPVAPILAIILCLAAIAVPILLGNQLLRDWQESFQTSTIIVLIVVTAYYAWQSQQQAEASRLMVEIIEQQRRDAVQPELVFCLMSSQIDFKQVLSTPESINLKGTTEVCNFGVGLARDIVSRIVVNGSSSPTVPLPPLAPRYWTRIDLQPHWAWLEDIRYREQGLIPSQVKVELRYCDTYGQPHVTALRLKHDDHGGDYLYFVQAVEYAHRESVRSELADKASSDGTGRVTPQGTFM